MSESDRLDDTASSVDNSSMIGSSVSKFLESETDSESEDEEEIEPKLKYERLSSDLRTILRKDAASAMAVHSKFLVLGSHWGFIHLLDAMGNCLPARQSQAHTIQVNQVSVDHDGEFYASCSDDGRVIVCGLYTFDNTHDIKMDRPVKAVAIDPIYARSNSGRRFMTGVEDKVTLHEKTFLSRYKTTVLCQGEGQVTSIKWRGRFAAWVTDKGVKVFDVVDETTISLIKSPREANEEIPWRISWIDQTNLIVSFGDWVMVCKITKRGYVAGPTRESYPDHMVEITSQFAVDQCWVCGMAPLDQYVVLLAVPKDLEDGKRQRPQLMVVEPLDDDYNLVSTDLMSIRGHEEYRGKDYQLEYLLDDKFYYILSPKDVIVGKPRDVDDHIDWLVAHEDFELALEETQKQEKLLKRHNFIDVGRKYLNFLIKSEQFDHAGRLCTKILGRTKKLWQEEVFKFAQVKRLKALAPYLPCGDIKLDPAIYEMVMFEFLKTDTEGFLKLVRTWSSDIYNIAAVVNVVIEQLLLDPDNETLLRALATLYTYQRKYDKAMAMYLKLRHLDVFQLIRQHSLFSAVHDKIAALIDLDTDAALKLFLDHSHNLPPDLIVDKLAANKRQQFLYLDALYTRDGRECPRKYHGRLVELYADYAPHKLLQFLKSSDQYPIQDALDQCELRGMTPERIYLLARMGNTRSALSLIITELSDIEQAVEFCKEHDDAELWSVLINYSLDKPIFINFLLNNIGTHVDPRILVEKIKEDMNIPGLRDSLIQIMRDYNLQVSLQEGCKRILVSDCYSLLQRKVRSASRGQSVVLTTCCPVCGASIVTGDPEHMTDMVAFNCRHVYHADCLAEATACGICFKAGNFDKNMTYFYKE